MLYTRLQPPHLLSEEMHRSDEYSFLPLSDDVPIILRCFAFLLSHSHLETEEKYGQSVI